MARRIFFWALALLVILLLLSLLFGGFRKGTRVGLAATAMAAPVTVAGTGGRAR